MRGGILKIHYSKQGDSSEIIHSASVKNSQVMERISQFHEESFQGTAWASALVADIFKTFCKQSTRESPCLFRRTVIDHTIGPLNSCSEVVIAILSVQTYGANVISSIPQSDTVTIAAILASHFVTIHFVIFASEI